MTTELADLLGIHIEAAKTTKLAACTEQGGPCDINQMMIWVDENDKTGLAVMDIKGDVKEYLGEALALLTEQSPKFVILVGEALGQSASSAEEAKELREKYERGKMSEDHRTLGPLAGLREFIALNAVDTITGDQMQAIAEFTYDDFGLPVFRQNVIGEIPRRMYGEAYISTMLDRFHQFMVWSRAQG